MSRKRMVADKSKIKEKMSTYMMLMGYNGDHQAIVAKDLNRGIWKRKSKLSKKKCRRLVYLLHAADSCTLLCYTVSLGRLIWSDHLRALRRKLEKKLAEKIKRRSVKKKRRRGRPGMVRAMRGLRTIKKLKEWKGNVGVPKLRRGYQMRPALGSIFKVIVRRRVTRRHPKLGVGNRMYRLAMAMYVLSFRNVHITSEWEFWTICFIQQVCGFWRSIAFGEGLSSSLIPIAKKFGLYVVSWERLERMESCYGCSSPASYLGASANMDWGPYMSRS